MVDLARPWDCCTSCRQRSRQNPEPERPVLVYPDMTISISVSGQRNNRTVVVTIDCEVVSGKRVYMSPFARLGGRIGGTLSHQDPSRGLRSREHRTSGENVHRGFRLLGQGDPRPLSRGETLLPVMPKSRSVKVAAQAGLIMR